MWREQKRSFEAQVEKRPGEWAMDTLIGGITGRMNSADWVENYADRRSRCGEGRSGICYLPSS